MHNIENNKIELKESISLVMGNMIGAEFLCFQFLYPNMDPLVFLVG